MMGLKDASYPVIGNWGQPEELHSTDFDPASPLPHTTPNVFLSVPSTRQPHPSAHRNTGVNSLYSMCLRVILRNISSVQDLGVLPYHHAKPILEECRIDQLILLEENSPHLLKHSEEIWKRNCLRDFIDLRKKYASFSLDNVKEPKSWRRLYFRTKGEIEQAKTDAAKRIKDKYEQHRAEKEAKKLVVRDRPMMAKTARSGGRKFGMTVAGGGVSKGQSLLNKARSGSAAQAKLTATRSARSPFRAQGRSKAVGAEIAPEAAGVEVRQLVRPMVAPRKVLGGASEGLTKMREFSRLAAGSEESDERETSTMRGRSAQQRPSVDGSTSARQHADVTPEHAIPRMRPHEVAAAPPLTPTLPSASTHVSDRSTTAETSNRKPPPSVPPPDIARTERRKIDFFGTNTKPSPTGTSSSSSPRASSSNATGVEVRGVKRAHSNSLKHDTRMSVTSPPASSSNGGTFFSTRAGNAGGSGVRVVQAKHHRRYDSKRVPAAAVASLDHRSKILTWHVLRLQRYRRSSYGLHRIERVLERVVLVRPESRMSLYPQMMAARAYKASLDPARSAERFRQVGLTQGYSSGSFWKCILTSI
ncbi:pof4 protein [Pseudozyma hubeiensis SY62]|uniref:Pof4 protein n=1 Tax=Pseudozyma hubeiensis (strain SY62) TaxID=1305764 RepID=R9PP62_PSEHS|nr:pof4 protein [Pseudozyma hubeiensis SY62]GAC99885.1 pof4 protein [Pseudozyma hubeiensis SY62]